MKSKDEHLRLVDLYLSGRASKEEVAELEGLLLTDPQLRSDFLTCARIDAALPSAVFDQESKLIELEKPHVTWSKLHWLPFVAIVLVFGLIWTGKMLDRSPSIQHVAHFENLNQCRWTDSSFNVKQGDQIAKGKRIELASGIATIQFSSGALLEMVGPAIVELRSINSGFLTMGEAHVIADTPESEGFTLLTPISTFIDIGTAFSARVSPDGLSRLDVSKGEVDVVVDGIDPRRFREGESVYVEPGIQKIMTRIESGESNPAFRFPSIAPPSMDDYADRANGRATIRVVQGELSPNKSGHPDVLIDGQGQKKQDAPKESAFFTTGTDGSFLLDLGDPITISKINTYSWHQHEVIEEHRERARQRFTLYGYTGDDLPVLDKDSDRQKSGWTRISRVNTDSFFQVSERLDRPAQQACSISAADGSIGRFRYLLWDVKAGSFYGEFDVFGKP